MMMSLGRRNEDSQQADAKTVLGIYPALLPFPAGVLRLDAMLLAPEGKHFARDFLAHRQVAPCHATEFILGAKKMRYKVTGLCS